MRLAECDLCKVKIYNAPLITINTKYQIYTPPQPTSLPFVSISGSVTRVGDPYNYGYSYDYGYASRQEHTMELCADCNAYMEKAMKFLHENMAKIRKEREEKPPAESVPQSEQAKTDLPQV